MENSRHFNFVKVTFFDIFFDISISRFLKFIFRGILILQFLTSRCEILMPGNFDIVCLDIPCFVFFRVAIHSSVNSSVCSGHLRRLKRRTRNRSIGRGKGHRGGDRTLLTVRRIPTLRGNFKVYIYI